MTFAWDFGDGSSSTEQNPSHMYTQRGTYTVTLEKDGKQGSATVEIRNGVISHQRIVLE